jgi:nickel-dependent lactate racemase
LLANRPASAAIAINDKTRPVPLAQLLPPLLRRLEAGGLAPEAITLYIANGMHPPMTPDEYPALLPPEIIGRYAIVSHNAYAQDSLAHRGETSRGTPVWINAGFAAAGLRIVIGNIEPHQFAGFSGGVKTAVIGLGGKVSINRNHSLLTHPDSRLGEYETNPARQDIEEMGTLCGVDFALNAVLNHHKQIVHALAGPPRQVMALGVPLSRRVCQVGVPAAYDLLIAAPGGHPKDINLYQAQKALSHAARVTRRGGAVILAAACPEGTGSQAYEDWMAGKTSHAQALAEFAREGFRIGPHKAFQIARDASQVRLFFVSQMPVEQARALLLNPVESLQAAVDAALESLPATARIGVLPNAASTIPYIVDC